MGYHVSFRECFFLIGACLNPVTEGKSSSLFLRKKPLFTVTMFRQDPNVERGDDFCDTTKIGGKMYICLMNLVNEYVFVGMF